MCMILGQFDRDWGRNRQLGLDPSIAPTPASVTPDPSVQTDVGGGAMPPKDLPSYIDPRLPPSETEAGPMPMPLKKDFSPLIRYLRG